VEIINDSVWLYFRFSLSFREVEELMLARGVVVSYETIRRWCDKFGQAYANQLRRRRPRPGDKWHLDEVFVPNFPGHPRPPNVTVPSRSRLPIAFIVTSTVSRRSGPEASQLAITA
jgi:hypothetical protein